MDCIAHKAKVVEADECEAGVRKSLNLGHTTAHAMELDSDCSHGECVLYGMLFETQIAMELDVCEKAYGQKLCALAQRALVYAPTKQPDFTKIADLAIRAKLDKKNADDGAVTLVVAKAKGEWAVLSLSYAEYANRLAQAIKRCGYDTHQA
jgi:3-dehydroquinate synthase